MSRDNRLYLAWLVALAAMLGSLYFSELRQFRPCILCWYQRVMMYPLVVILGIAALKGDHSVRRYVLALAVIGWGTALFQNLETWGVVPTIRALRNHGERVRQAEVERALRSLQHLSAGDQEAIDALTRALLNKLLHSPTVRLRQAAGNGRGTGVLDTVRYLFELEPEAVPHED